MVLGKHFVADVKSPVERALKCLLEVNPTLGLIESHKVIYKRSDKSDKVVLISGGGSGHEPAHAGFIGDGMLDVAVAGDIFASPSAAQILVGLQAIESPKGTLMIVKNYTGDKLNFGLAAQKARAGGQDISVVFVNEDASLDAESLVGRRGLAGTVFVHKIAGAAAARGASLSDVTRIAQKVADSVATVGVSLDKCSVPGRGNQEGLPSGELEYGMGIHNEPGVLREGLTDVSTTVAKVLSYLLAPGSPIPPTTNSNLAVMVNNLGGLSILELNVIAHEVLQQLAQSQYKFTLLRKYVGTFMTSLDGPGFSVTLLRLDSDGELLPLLDDPTTAPAWPKQLPIPADDAPQSRISQYSPPANKPTPSQDTTLTIPTATLTSLTAAILARVRADEPTITRYDTLAGDGDCGTTLLSGITAVHAALQATASSSSTTTALPAAIERAAEAVEASMGGTSGALYAIFLHALAGHIRRTEDAGSLPASFQRALPAALAELCTFTLARRGDRTLMDALIPFVETFAQTGQLPAAIAEARRGCDATRTMAARMGRASYVAATAVQQDGGVVDPGALGVVCILEELGKEIAE